MSNSRAFYITLPSNVKTFSNKPNKTSNYTTYLPKALELSSSQWEVSLCEISYPHSWDNIYPAINKITFFFRENRDGFSILQREVEIPRGYYTTLEELVESINNEKPPEFKGSVGFEKASRKRVKIILHTFEGIEMHPTIAGILGFDENKWFCKYSELSPFEDRTRIKASRPGDIRALSYNMYIYSNIVKDNLVGDRLVPLLRTVNVEGGDGDYIHKIYEIPHYLPLASDFIEHIEIRIANDQGDLIHFEFGKVIVKLHFRRKQIFV